MEKNYKIGKDIFIAALKAILCSFLVFAFLAIGLYVINPKATAKICQSLGWKRAEVSCYELVYARSKNNDDLYNVIVKLGAIKSSARQIEYINKLKNSEQYAQFCENLDNSVIENFNIDIISAKTLSLVFGTDEYLTSSLALDNMYLRQYQQGYDIIEDIISSGAEDGTYSLVLYSYVDYLMSENVSKEVSYEYAEKLFISGAIDYLNSRVTSLGTTDADQVLQSHLQVKIEYSKYVIYYFVEGGESISTTTAYGAWQSAVENYNSKIAE